MSRFQRPLGVLLCMLGATIALVPIVSVLRVSGQVLDELPEIPAAEIRDDRNRLGALFDDDFVLASRTYQPATPRAVRDALVSGGFEVHGFGERQWLVKPCCGEYDGVWVQIEPAADRSVVALLSVADSDIQSSWPIFIVLGLLLLAPGSLLVSRAAAGGPTESAPQPTRPGG